MKDATRDFIEQGKPFKSFWSVREGQYVIADSTGYVHAKCDDDQDAAEAIADKLNEPSEARLECGRPRPQQQPPQQPDC